MSAHEKQRDVERGVSTVENAMLLCILVLGLIVSVDHFTQRVATSFADIQMKLEEVWLVNGAGNRNLAPPPSESGLDSRNNGDSGEPLMPPPAGPS